MQQTITNISRFYDSTEIQPGFKDIMFINKGTSTVNINNYILAPGESFVDNSSENEINNTTYFIKFIAGGTNNLFVFVKKYV